MLKIPFYKPSLGREEVEEVIATLKSGWLTTGPKCRQFEQEFSQYLHQPHSIAVNSCTAALHLALEASGLKAGDGVIVPTMTFAATAEVVRYLGARPILADCRPEDFNLDVTNAELKIQSSLQAGQRITAIMPVHYAGQVGDVTGVGRLARRYGLKVIEDAAHCCPAFYRLDPAEDGHRGWQTVGSSADISCYSFYANKPITTAEGGMACTANEQYAERMRIMSLHGISRDAWKRYTAEGSWYYEIIAPGYKYNMTDIAAAIGIHQLRKADLFHRRRSELAGLYSEHLRNIEEVVVPEVRPNRIHSWHLYVVRLKLSRLTIDRSQFISELQRRGIGASVHWMPLHLHPYYRQTYGLVPEDLPTATRLYPEIFSLPLYPELTETDVKYVCDSIREIVVASLRHRFQATQEEPRACATRS